MSDGEPVAEFAAPFGQQVQLQDVKMENGVRMMRVRIRERSRFTVFDIDPATASAWGRAMADWAAATGTLDEGADG
jgi:hypothetical protein